MKKGNRMQSQEKYHLEARRENDFYVRKLCELRG